MVRTVEPDPPEPLRRIDPRVPRTESKPDKLGYQRVAERQERQPQGHERPESHPLDGDQVTLHEPTEAEPGSERDPDSDKSDDPPASHVDVEG